MYSKDSSLISPYEGGGGGTMEQDMSYLTHVTFTGYSTVYYTISVEHCILLAQHNYYVYVQHKRVHVFLTMYSTSKNGSLTATTETPPFSSAALITRRPIRPNL